MSEPREPIRLLDDPATSEALRRTLAEAARDVPALSHAAVLSRLEQATSAPSAAAGLSTAKIVALVVAGGLVVGAALWWATSEEAPPPEPSREHDSAPVGAALDQRASETGEEEAAPSVEASEAIATTEHDDGEREARPRRRAHREERAEAPRAEDDDALAREMAELARARRVLEADPSGALSILERERAAHPGSLFAEEREALTVLALLRLERPGADGRAERFLSAHPASPFAARVRRALAEAE